MCSFPLHTYAPHCSEVPSTYVLVDQNNGDVLPLLGELIESLLDSCVLGLAVHDQVVLLRVRGLGDMLGNVSDIPPILSFQHNIHSHQRPPAGCPSQSPTAR